MGVPFQWGYALTHSLCNGNTSKFSIPSPRLQHPGNNTLASVFLYKHNRYILFNRKCANDSCCTMYTSSLPVLRNFDRPRSIYITMYTSSLPVLRNFDRPRFIYITMYTVVYSCYVKFASFKPCYVISIDLGSFI